MSEMSDEPDLAEALAVQITLASIDERLWDGSSDDPRAQVALGRGRFVAKSGATPKQLEHHERNARQWRLANEYLIRRGHELLGDEKRA